MPLLTGQKVPVGKVGKEFSTFIYEAHRLQVTFRNKALINLSFTFQRLRLNTEMIKYGYYPKMRILYILD